MMHGMHGRAGDASKEVGVDAIPPNMREHTELEGAIQGWRGCGVRRGGAAGDEPVMDATPQPKP